MSDKKIVKTLKIYLYFFTFFVFLSLIYSYSNNINLILTLKSVLYGFIMFIAMNAVDLYFYIRVKYLVNNPKIDILYAFYRLILKLFVLVFCCWCCFRFFELNNKIVIISFVIVVIFNVLIYVKYGVNEQK